MKPNRDASELAARLAGAAATPVPLPTANAIAPAKETPAIPPKAAAAPQTARKGRPAVATVGITLRPSKTLLQRYTMAAAERTRKTGRVISAQEMMLERLEDGP